MKESISDLVRALRERRAIIFDQESRTNESQHLDRLQAISKTIELLEAALPEPVDPRLAHYLERRSYDKALEYLENEESEN